MDPLRLLLARQDAGSGNDTVGDAGGDAGSDAPPVCQHADPDSSYRGLRIASVFIIFVGSALGALLPVLLARTAKFRGSNQFFFIAKYFGSGIILATAFIHLLSPASDALRDDCLSGILPDYDWAMGIALMTIMVMFLLELIISNFDFGFSHSHEHDHEISSTGKTERGGSNSNDPEAGSLGDSKSVPFVDPKKVTSTGGPLSADRLPTSNYPPGNEDHLGHGRDHVEGDQYAQFAGQLTAIFILEFGVIFHSIFIGLTLAVTDNFIILFVVLVFHQTFEGLGLGSRLATATWPQDRRRFMPYLLGILYAISTPLSIGIGLGVKESLYQDSATGLIVNGVFDAISAGILIYTGLVELLAHEFMFNEEMRKAGLKVQLYAYTCVAVGVGLMALLGKWA